MVEEFMVPPSLQGDGGGLAGASSSPIKQSGPSDTVLELDAWGKRRGAELTQRMPQLKGSDKSVVADFNGAAFEPYHQFADRPKNERLAEYMEKLIETPEFKSLHRLTRMDVESSELATVSFHKAWDKYNKEQEKVEEIQQEEESYGGIPDPEGKKIDKIFRMARYLGEGLRDAKREVKELEDLRNAMDFSSEDGNGGKMHKDNIASAYKKLRNSVRLQAIIAKAGRFRMFAQAAQRKKDKHGRDEVCGITRGDELNRMLGSERARLGDPDMEDLMMLKVLSKQALMRKLEGTKKVGKGPIVFCCDESGSMTGERIENAKAIGLSMAWIAKLQNRPIEFVSFATRGRFLHVPGSDMGQVLEWLEHFFAGGTDPDAVLELVPAQWDDMALPDADIICVTDDCMSVPPEMAAKFLKFKEEKKVKLHTILVGHGGTSDYANALAPLSDTIASVGDLDLEEDGVRQLLSL